MKIEKAIEMIDKVWHPSKYSNEVDNELHVDADELDKACELAISALEKQLPKQVNEITTTKYKIFLDGYCPTCVRYLTSTINYCPDCGQKLDWLEVEND